MSTFLEDAFGVSDPSTLASRTEAFKSAMTDAVSKPGRFVPNQSAVEGAGHYVGDNTSVERSINEVLGKLDKSVGADVLASIQSELASKLGADLTKDWTTTSPISTGLVAYDLQAPAKFLVPVATPLRNSTPRTKGVGLSALWKVITGITGSGTGGVASTSPFFASQSGTASFGSLSLLRPPKISYAGSDKSAGYVEWGQSDEVTYKAQFAGVGFEDMRALSATALLYSSMLAEERALLYGRGTGSGYAGAIAQPTATAAGTGSGSITATVLVQVTAVGGWGESVPSTEVTTGALTSKNVTVTITPVTGAIGYNVYATTGATTTEKFQTFTTSLAPVLTTITSSGAAVPVADSSGTATSFDGLLTTQLGTGSGYASYANAALSTSTPGSEFQTAFAQLYYNSTNGNVQADPDNIWIYGAGRKGLTDAMLTGTSTNYRYTINGDGNNVRMGGAVTGITNETTGKDVPIKVHPYMPLGCALILSDQLPNVPNSGISATRELRMVQDYVGIDWPQIQMTYDRSVYEFGTFVQYAPLWSGAIAGLTNV